jgi:hypothetical protein
VIIQDDCRVVRRTAKYKIQRAESTKQKAESIGSREEEIWGTLLSSAFCSLLSVFCFLDFEILLLDYLGRTARRRLLPVSPMTIEPSGDSATPWGRSSRSVVA